MLIIGLYGGSPESRHEIQRALVNPQKRPELQAFACPPAVRLAGARVHHLRTALEQRARGIQVLLITHVETVEEAQLLKERGARMWYVMGQPSEVIPLARGDLPVTGMVGGCRHYLDPLEALSQSLLDARRVR